MELGRFRGNRHDLSRGLLNVVRRGCFPCTVLDVAQEHGSGKSTRARERRSGAGESSPLGRPVLAILILAALAAILSAAAVARQENAPGQNPPMVSTLPSISGTYREGQTLIANPGTWNGPDRDYEFQWVRCNNSGSLCVPIIAANGQTHPVIAADVGATLRILVTATNKNGSTVATSNATSVIAPALSTKSFSTTSTPTTTSTTGSTTTTTTTTTTTPTTTTTTTQIAALAFQGNWETGNYSQWTWGAQCSNTGEPDSSYVRRGTLNLVTDTVAQGTYSGRFDLPADTTRTTACEVLRKRTLAVGSDDWYALEVYFPSNWQEPSSQFWGLLIAQLNYQALTGPPVGLFAHRDHVNLGVKAGRCIVGGACQFTTGNDDASQGNLGYTLRLVPVGSLTPGSWHQFVIHAHWATDSSGVIEGWWRQRGGTWTKTVTWGGYPTVQWTDTERADATDLTSDKIGAYRAAASFPLTIHQDGFCVATSFASAASCL